MGLDGKDGKKGQKGERGQVRLINGQVVPVGEKGDKVYFTL